MPCAANAAAHSGRRNAVVIVWPVAVNTSKGAFEVGFGCAARTRLTPSTGQVPSTPVGSRVIKRASLYFCKFLAHFTLIVTLSATVTSPHVRCLWGSNLCAAGGATSNSRRVVKKSTSRAADTVIAFIHSSTFLKMSNGIRPFWRGHCPSACRLRPMPWPPGSDSVLPGTRLPCARTSLRTRSCSLWCPVCRPRVGVTLNVCIRDYIRG